MGWTVMAKSAVDLLPEGFQIDQQSPSVPDGFVLDAPEPEFNELDAIRQIRSLNQKINTAQQREAVPSDYRMTPMGYMPTSAKPDVNTQREILDYDSQVKSITNDLVTRGVPKSTIADTLDILKSVEPYGQGEAMAKQAIFATAGGVVAGVPGAIVGGLAGNVLGQTQNPDDPKFSMRQAAEQAAIEGVFEGVGRYGIPSLKYAGKWFKGRLPKKLAYPLRSVAGFTDPATDIKRSDKILRSLQEGATLPPATKNPDSQMVRFIQEWAQSSLGGDIAFENMDIANQKAVIKYFNRVIDQSATHDDAGKAILNQFWQGGKGMPKGLKVDAINDITTKMYDEVQELTGLVQKGVDDLGSPIMESKANVYIKDLRDWATDKLLKHRHSVKTLGAGPLEKPTVRLLEEIEQLGKSDEIAKAMKEHGELLSKLSPDDQKRFINQLGIESADTDFAPLELMRDLRTKYMKQGQSLEYTTSVAQGIHDDAIGKIGNAFNHDKTLAAMPKAAAEKLKNANKVYSQTSDVLDSLFDKKFMEALRTEPHTAAKQLLPAQGTSKIKAVRDALTTLPNGSVDIEGTIAWDKLRHAKLGEIIKKSTVHNKALGIDEIDLSILKKIISDFGDDAFQELFKTSTTQSTKEYRRFKRGLKLIELAQVEHGRPYAIVGAGKQIGATTKAARGVMAMAGLGAGGVYLYGGRDGFDSGDVLAITALSTLAIGPTFLAKLMTSPGGNDILEGAAKLSLKKGGATVPTAIRMLRIRQKMDEDDAKMEARAEEEFIKNLRRGQRQDAFRRQRGQRQDAFRRQEQFLEKSKRQSAERRGNRTVATPMTPEQIKEAKQRFQSL
jgi:hypothetical protein